MSLLKYLLVLSALVTSVVIPTQNLGIKTLTMSVTCTNLDEVVELLTQLDDGIDGDVAIENLKTCGITTDTIEVSVRKVAIFVGTGYTREIHELETPTGTQYTYTPRLGNLLNKPAVPPLDSKASTDAKTNN